MHSPPRAWFSPTPTRTPRTARPPARRCSAANTRPGTGFAEIERLGERENTVIVFSSDNGGYGPATDMDPLYGYKGTYFEGGIRVPLFVNWPGVVAPGKSSGEPVIGVDIYPTICAIAGAPLPDQPVDGRSLLPLLKGENETFGTRPVYWHFPAYLESYSNTEEQRDPLFRARPVAAIRIGDYKLKEYYEDGHIALYHLKDDIRERKNLADERPEKRDELLKELHRWQDELGAKRTFGMNPAFDEKAERKTIKKAE